MVRPPTRWATTISGLSSSVTVHMPSSAWNTTSSTSAAGRRYRLRRVVAMPEGEDRDGNDHEHETAGDEAMKHFPERLVLDDRTIRKGSVDFRGIGGGLTGRQVAVAPRPVRTAETRVIEAYPGAEHDDAERDQRAEQAQLAETS